MLFGHVFDSFLNAYALQIIPFYAYEVFRVGDRLA